MHRAGTVIAGRVVSDDGSQRVPLNGAVVTLAAVWRSFPAANVDPLTVREAPNLVALSPDPTLDMKVRQGVTLEIIGQDGLGVAPLRSGDVFSRREQLKVRLGSPDVDWNWRSVLTTALWHPAATWRCPR